MVVAAGCCPDRIGLYSKLLMPDSPDLSHGGGDDFDWSILARTTHRPWPVPSRNWLMTQTWTHLLFAHWRVDPEVLRPLVPAPFALDTFEGDAWIGIVPFWMSNVAPRRGRAVCRLPACAELNVRTYVRVDDKPGVYFFSLDASSTLVVAGARMLFNLPYHRAAMSVTTAGSTVHYRSVRRSDQQAAFAADYEPAGPVSLPQPGSLDYFLTERYCLYQVDRRRRPYRLEILHPPWPLQPARARIAQHTIADAAGVRLPDTSPVFHVSARQDMVAWGPDYI